MVIDARGIVMRKHKKILPVLLLLLCAFLSACSNGMQINQSGSFMNEFNSKDNISLCTRIYDNALYYIKPDADDTSNIDVPNFNDIYRYDLNTNTEQCIFSGDEIDVDVEMYFYSENLFFLNRDTAGVEEDGYSVIKIPLDTFQYEQFYLDDIFSSLLELPSEEIVFSDSLELDRLKLDGYENFPADFNAVLGCEFYGVSDNKAVLVCNFVKDSLYYSDVVLYDLKTGDIQQLTQLLPAKQNDFGVSKIDDIFYFYPFSVTDNEILLMRQSSYSENFGFYQYKNERLEKIEDSENIGYPLFASGGYIYYISHSDGTFITDEGKKYPAFSYINKVKINDLSDDTVVDELEGFVYPINHNDVKTLGCVNTDSNTVYYLVNNKGEVLQTLPKDDLFAREGRIVNDYFQMFSDGNTIIYLYNCEEHLGLPSENRWTAVTECYKTDTRNNEPILLFSQNTEEYENNSFYF